MCETLFERLLNKRWIVISCGTYWDEMYHTSFSLDRIATTLWPHSITIATTEPAATVVAWIKTCLHIWSPTSLTNELQPFLPVNAIYVWHYHCFISTLLFLPLKYTESTVIPLASLHSFILCLKYSK